MRICVSSRHAQCAIGVSALSILSKVLHNDRNTFRSDAILRAFQFQQTLNVPSVYVSYYIHRVMAQGNTELTTWCNVTRFNKMATPVHVCKHTAVSHNITSLGLHCGTPNNTNSSSFLIFQS